MSCRVEQFFGEVEKHDAVLGKCSFCRVRMSSLLPVPTCSSRLNLTPRPDPREWNNLAELFRAVRKTV